MTPTKLFCAVIAGIVGLCIALLSLPPRRIATKESDTIAAIRTATESLVALDPERKASLLSAIEANPDYTERNRRLVQAFNQREDIRVRINRHVLKDGLIVDAWNTPLYVLTDRNSSYSRVNPVATNNEFAFTIWSAGSNRSNEMGFGDDIFLSTYKLRR